MRNKIILSVIVVALVLALYFVVFKDERELDNINENMGTQTATSTEVIKEEKKYSMADVAPHNNKQDCWIVINGRVNDVTSFIKLHPGGERILEGCGKDATALFNTIPGHAKSIAKQLLKKYDIGEVTK